MNWPLALSLDRVPGDPAGGYQQRHGVGRRGQDGGPVHRRQSEFSSSSRTVNLIPRGCQPDPCIGIEIMVAFSDGVRF